MQIDIGFEYLTIAGVAIFILFAAAAYFGQYYFGMRSKNPELHVLNKARDSPFPPVITMVDPTGRQLYFNGEKERREEAKLKNEDYGLLIDPLLMGKLPESRLVDGSRQYFYGAGFYFPTSPNGARTIVQLVRKIRSEYPQLNFIRDDITIIELLFKTGSDLPKDIETVIKQYPLEDYYGNDAIQELGIDKSLLPEQLASTLADTFEEIKGKLKQWKVEPGWFSMHEGLSLLPIGTQSNDMKRLETITKINTMNDVLKEPPVWEGLLKIVVIVGGLLVLAYMIIVNVRPGGGA